MKNSDQLLSRLKEVLEIAKKNKNQTFIENIERDIKAIKEGNESPIINEYLTEGEIDIKTK